MVAGTEGRGVDQGAGLAVRQTGDVTIGEMPSSISVPLFDARMTLIQ
jgi:hypothetical protein